MASCCRHPGLRGTTPLIAAAAPGGLAREPGTRDRALALAAISQRGRELVAHALVRAASRLVGMPGVSQSQRAVRADSLPLRRRRHEWRRGTHECVRHGSGLRFAGDMGANEAGQPATIGSGPSRTRRWRRREMWRDCPGIVRTGVAVSPGSASRLRWRGAPTGDWLREEPRAPQTAGAGAATRRALPQPRRRMPVPSSRPAGGFVSGGRSGLPWPTETRQRPPVGPEETQQRNHPHSH